MRPARGNTAAAAGIADHGGNLEAVAASYGIDSSTLTDLSANVNPLGPPGSVLAALQLAAADTAALQRYPEPTYRVLRKHIARELAIDPASIVVGHGAAALLEAALGDAMTTRCVLPVPAFSENYRALDALGIETTALQLEAGDDFKLDTAALLRCVRSVGAQAVLLTNPHNPSGSLLPRTQMTALVEELAALGCRTIVDEAFIDYVPAESVSNLAATGASLTCVRSLTKFFAIPALRVGYLVCSPRDAASYRGRLASWPVTSLAAVAAGAAFDDPDFAAHTRAINASERAWLRRELQALGCRVPHSAANFVLAELPPPETSSQIAERLARDFRIVVRDCSTYAGLASGRWIRIAVRTRVESARVISALATIVG